MVDAGTSISFPCVSITVLVLPLAKALKAQYALRVMPMQSRMIAALRASLKERMEAEPEASVFMANASLNAIDIRVKNNTTFILFTALNYR